MAHGKHWVGGAADAQRTGTSVLTITSDHLRLSLADARPSPLSPGPAPQLTGSWPWAARAPLSFHPLRPPMHTGPSDYGLTPWLLLHRPLPCSPWLDIEVEQGRWAPHVS